MTNAQTVAAFLANPSRDVRNGNGTLYSEGGTLYSYGPHYPLARPELTAAGERVVFVNADGYSATTTRHLGLVRRFSTCRVIERNAAHLRELRNTAEA